MRFMVVLLVVMACGPSARPRPAYNPDEEEETHAHATVQPTPGPAVHVFPEVEASKRAIEEAQKKQAEADDADREATYAAIAKPPAVDADPTSAPTMGTSPEEGNPGDVEYTDKP